MENPSVNVAVGRVGSCRHDNHHKTANAECQYACSLAQPGFKIVYIYICILKVLAFQQTYYRLIAS